MKLKILFYPFVVILLVLLLLCVHVFAKDDNEDRIVGGYFTNIKNHKYLVQLLYYGDWICGASLVSQRHIVTAAHCVENSPARAFSINAGTTYLTKRGIIRRVRRVWKHPKFNSWTLANDIAVMALKRRVSGPNIVPIALPQRNLRKGYVVTVVGWGDTRENGIVSNQMRAVKVTVQSNRKCNAAYGGEITRSMMCATKPGKDACQGDSGGPLVRNGVLYGLVSWGDGCARPGSPGVYTNVLKLKNFILSKIN